MFDNQFKLELEDYPPIVLDGRRTKGFDSYSVAFPCVFKENKDIFLYYTGSPDACMNAGS